MNEAEGDVGELDLHFLGGAGGLAAFEDVLFAGACRLHHLVDGAVFTGEEALAETVGEIVDDLGFLVGEQLTVVAVGGDEAGGGGWRHTLDI